jgi:hypothetical protein
VSERIRSDAELIAAGEKKLIEHRMWVEKYLIACGYHPATAAREAERLVP